MRILVSTDGTKADDFNFTKPDEIVRFGHVCDNGCACGCSRSMVGIESGKATTAVKIFDRPDIDEPSLAQMFLDSYKQAGWLSYTLAAAQRQAHYIADYCRTRIVGTVIEPVRLIARADIEKATRVQTDEANAILKKAGEALMEMAREKAVRRDAEHVARVLTKENTHSTPALSRQAMEGAIEMFRRKAKNGN